MIEAGAELDRYVVEAELGAGGHATVWLVRHQVLGSLHAMKVLHLGSAANAARFLQEGRLQARLEHPNIVPVTDVVPTRAGVALVMPYIAGPSLAGWLAGNRADLDTTLSIASGILEGLGFAHDHGVIHRDLKPGNVLLAPSPSGFVPRLTDFGVARDLEADAPLTGTGIALGTLAYMAPEQARSSRDVDARSDLFSFGCLLYELATGARAFPGTEPLSVATAAAQGHFRPLRAHDPTLPASLEALVAACLEPDAARRPRSCAEVRARLVAIRAGATDAPTRAAPRPASPAPAASTPWKRRVLTGVAAVSAAGSLVAWVVPWRAAVTYPHTDGYALHLDGQSALRVAPTPALDLGGPVTLAAWVLPEAWHFGESFPILDRGWRLETSTRTISFTVGMRTGTIAGVGLALGRWNHVAVTYHPIVGIARWYVDGVAVFEEPYREAYYDFAKGPSVPLYIGAGPYGRLEMAHGYLDDVRIWARELGSEEVRAVAEGGVFDVADLIAEWTFDEGPGDVVPDRTGNGHDAALEGRPAWVAPRRVRTR